MFPVSSGAPVLAASSPKMSLGVKFMLPPTPKPM